MTDDRPVAIDGRALVRAQIGGVERYARELTRGLLALAPERYRLLSPRPRLAHRVGHAWEQVALPWLAREQRLLYCPANLAPIAGRDNVVVIHDVAALAHPDAYSRLYVAYQRAVLPAIARRARQLITVSEFSREEIASRLQVQGERIEVIAPGVDARFSPEADARAAASALLVEGPYVLALGTASARKNHAALAAAARALHARGIELLIAGSERGYLRGAGDGPGRALDYVPEAHLPGLYAGAVAFVMPSLYEGFGLPCLEAMASGTPVVAAAAGALPATCGDAALLVDPHDQGAIAAAVLAAAGEERERLVVAGLARARQFSWQASARATDAAIGRVLAREVAPGA